MDDIITPWMLDKIKEGKAILFLGAGASYGAKGNNGQTPLSANALRDCLCDKFLGGEAKDKSLIQVADYAKNESSLNDVQVFLKKQFEPINPAEFHKIIPKFKWHAIFTTNYDLVIERAYDDCQDRFQNLAPILRDGDNFSEKMSDPDSLPFIKLHGCITVVTDHELPLILASEEYAKHRNNRERLFRHLQDFGREHPIIFCGYQINDPNIQQILFDLNDQGVHRPTYMVIDPGLNSFDMRLWQSKRMIPVKKTFEEFLDYIDKKIPCSLRLLGKLISKEQCSLTLYLKTDSNTSVQLIQYVDTELEHIIRGIPVKGIKPEDFYKGLDDNWGGVSQDLDIKRRVGEQILLDSLLDEKLKGSQLFLLKGHAGSGKTIALKRLAWDASKNLENGIFYLKKGAVLRPGLVKELSECCEKRLLLIVDGVLENKDDLLKFLNLCSHECLDISIVISARSNEWNLYGRDIESYVNAEYELESLTQNEISDLVKKLTTNNCLGALKDKTVEEIKDYFTLTSDRQLLVALHEATSGKSFEDIVLDEYRRIIPAEARILYMDVCTLNRLNVPLRAGLVSRISNIEIDQFRGQFLKPLDHVVKIYMDNKSRDYVYIARHPIIAQFVFDYALEKPEEKAQQIIRVIRHMNLDYSADNEAFSKLIKGKTLVEVFGDKALVKQIYDSAEIAGVDKSYIWHQRTVYELNHPGCDISSALSSIKKAENFLLEGKSSKAILHTKALVYKKLAKKSHSRMEIDKYRAEARIIFERLSKQSRDSRPFSGLAEIFLAELSDRLAHENGNNYDNDIEDLQSRTIVELIKKVQGSIYKGLQKFPNDEYLLSQEAELANKLDDSNRALRALEKAYHAGNKASEYIAIRLARYKKNHADENLGIEIIKDSIQANPNSKALHLELAKILIRKNDESLNKDIIYHLKRSFSPNDTNYDAQYWYARHLYLYDNKEEAKSVFSNLKKAKLPPYQKNKLRGEMVNSSGEKVILHGQVLDEHVDFFFIQCNELNEIIFSHISKVKGNSKNNREIRRGINVTFKLAFSMKGATGFDIEIT